MAIIIGSARIDERGKISGGDAGDQKQTSVDDMAGEVSMQNFYVHRKGWHILRAKDAAVANRLAENMKTACNNPNIGYDQANRSGVVQYGVNTTTKTACDCSSLVRACVTAASGKDPGNFNTASEAAALSATGLFDKHTFTAGTTLYTGDILVTKTKGHTAIVINGIARTASTAPSAPSAAPAFPHREFVKEVQAAIGAKIDGIAGKETLSKTVTVSKSKNNRHAVVKPLQKYLYAIGYTSVGAADGIAGTKFDTAVKAYQRANGCAVDGEITGGNKTWKKLLGLM